MKKLGYLLSALATTLLVACGGGGGGGGGSSSAPAPTAAVTVPLLAAIQRSANTSQAYNFDVTGYWSTAGNNLTGSGSRTVSAGVSSVVSGTTYTKITGTTLGSATATNGTVLNLNSTGVEYLNPSTYATVIVDDGDAYAVYSTYTYPTTLTSGDTGQYATAVIYSNSSKTTVIGTAKFTYVTSANTSDSLTVKQIVDVFNTGTQQTLQSISTSTISTAGVSTLVSFEQYRYAASGSTPYYLKYSVR